MFSPKMLKGIQRRKRLIIARSDLLREETGKLWDASTSRTAVLETGFLQKLRPYSSIIFTVSLAALALTRSKLAPRHRMAGKACSVAGFLLAAMRPTPSASRQKPLDE
jgi:hypothetical protein